VETHIEPLEVDDLEGVDVEEAERARIAGIIRTLADGQDDLSQIHDVRVRRVARGLFVTLHCHAPPDLPVEALHHQVDALERRVRETVGGVARVVTHAEPLKGG
jgi:divalent metal cation (Fe/Co/Zn/Cd) transporter